MYILRTLISGVNENSKLFNGKQNIEIYLKLSSNFFPLLFCLKAI